MIDPVVLLGLIAEGFSNMEVAGGAAGAGVVGVASTLAVIKWRQNKAEQRDDKQDEKQDNLSKALNDLSTKIVEQGSETREAMVESERRTDKKLTSVQSSLSGKIDSLKETQREHGEKIAVLENECTHTKDRLDSHSKSIRSLTGFSPPNSG